MTKEKLYLSHTEMVCVSRKKKGAGKGYKCTYDRKFKSLEHQRAYYSKLREMFPRDYALLLIASEHYDMENDRYWDTPMYRSEAIRDYRNRIHEIKEKYGLSHAEVKSYYHVN